MRQLTLFASIFLVLHLSACGGGGGGGGGGDSSSTSSDATNAQQQTNTTAIEEVIEETTEISPSVPQEEEDSTQQEITRTSDIVTTEDFLLTSMTTLNLSIGIADLVAQRAYLNICHPKGDNSIDYNNCVLNMPLRDGTHEGKITLGNEVDRLIAEIWRYDINAEPLIYLWENSEDTWRIN